MARITIIGTGFIGTSLGLALKAQKTTVEIVGHDRDFARSGEARKQGAVDRAEWNLPAALEGAGLVVVATPLAAIEQVFSDISGFLPQGAVVTDTALLKAPVLGWATTHLAGRAHYVGGNPIVGADEGERKPTASLFQDRTYCVVPGASASDVAVDQVLRLVAAVGAKPMFFDPVEHDSHVAVVGQLPMLLASTLMNLASTSPSWRDGQRLAGNAFGAATALALEDPKEQRALLRANRETIVRLIHSMRSELDELARLVDVGADDALLKTLEGAQDLRAAWQPGLGPQPELPATEIPRARDQFSSWFVGRWGNRNRGK